MARAPDGGRVSLVNNGLDSPPPISVPAPLRALLASLVVSTLWGGCVFFTTQAYDFAQERWQLCERRFPGTQLEQIDPDGLIRFSQPEPVAAAGMRDCLNETADRQSLRVLAPPPPRAIALPTPQ